MCRILLVSPLRMVTLLVAQKRMRWVSSSHKLCLDSTFLGCHLFWQNMQKRCFARLYGTEILEILMKLGCLIFPGVRIPQIPSYGNGIPQIWVHRSDYRAGGGGRGAVRFERLLEREVANTGGCKLHGQHQDFGNGVMRFLLRLTVFFFQLTLRLILFRLCETKTPEGLNLSGGTIWV